MRGQLPTQPLDESKDSFIRFPEDTRVMAHETPLRITVGYVQWEEKRSIMSDPKNRRLSI